MKSAKAKPTSSNMFARNTIYTIQNTQALSSKSRKQRVASKQRRVARKNYHKKISATAKTTHSNMFVPDTWNLSN